MAFSPDIPSNVIPDFPGGPEWDSANELKGEPWEAVDPAKVAAMTYPPEERDLCATTDTPRPGYDLDPNRDPNFNPVIGRA